MKGEAELNALLLLGKNYQRLSEMTVGRDGQSIVIRYVPDALFQFFLDKFRKTVEEETIKALEQYKEAAKKYAAAIE